MIEIKRDGRVIRTGRDYSEFRKSIFENQNGCCADCGIACEFVADPDWHCSFHVHHKHGRGLGGSRRTDTLEECVGWCGACHHSHHEEERNGWSKPTAEN
jgi:hypothetical protein